MWETLQHSFDLLFSVDRRYVLTAIGLYVIGLFIVGMRWRIMIHALGGRAHLLQTTVSNLAGIFFNNVTPASRLTGEACRIALIRNREHLDLKVATVSSIYDRLTDIPVIGILVLLSLPTLHRMAADLNRYIVIGVGVVLFCAVAFIIYKKLTVLRNWISVWIDKLSSLWLRRSAFALGVGFSGLLWVQDLVRLMVVAAAFGIILTPSQAATLAVCAIFGGLVPTVGGLGVIEGGMVAALVLFGVEIETAIAITALERAIAYGFGTSAGGVAVVALGGKKIWNAAKAIT